MLTRHPATGRWLELTERASPTAHAKQHPPMKQRVVSKKGSSSPTTDTKRQSAVVNSRRFVKVNSIETTNDDERFFWDEEEGSVGEIRQPATAKSRVYARVNSVEKTDDERDLSDENEGFAGKYRYQVMKKSRVIARVSSARPFDGEQSLADEEEECTGQISKDGKRQFSKAQILEWMVNGGTPWDIAQRLAALYAQQQAMNHPPPLPPRSGLAAIDPEPPLPSSKTFKRCNILIVDQYNSSRTLLAQHHLEFLRMWTANNGGPWLFSHVSSAGLYIPTPWGQSSGALVGDDKSPETQFRSPDEAAREFAFELFSKGISEEPPLSAISSSRTDDQPFECDRIADRIRMHRFKGVDGKVFAEYDYILVFDKQIEKALHMLSERVCDSWNSSLRHGELKGWQDLPRICRLEGKDDKVDPNRRKNRPRAIFLYTGVYFFAEDMLGFKRPENDTMDGGLRTSFLQVQSAVQIGKLMDNQGEGLKRIEQWTDCKLHLSKQSEEYGWVVAIVGLRDRLWEAEVLVKKLRNGEEIE